MKSLTTPLAPPAPGRTRPRLLDRLPAWAAVIGTGLLLGQQYMNPNKRVLAVLAAVIATGLAWRVGMLAGIGILVLAVPYPRGTVFGSTNLALILVLLVIWLLRVTQRESPAPRRTPVDVVIVTLFIVYVLSFYNVQDRQALVIGIEHFELFIGCILMFYLIVSNIRSNSDLEWLHLFQVGSAVSLFLVSVYELNHPGAPLVAGWLDFTQTVGTEFNTRNVRVGATFRDYELLSEFAAVTLLLLVFLIVRARSTSRRTVFGLIAVLDLFVLFATVTRGAVISLAVGVLLFLWIVRRHLRVVPMTILGVGAAAAIAFMNYFVANFTRSGDMFARLMKTRLEGVVPAERADIWDNAFRRALVHPLFGQGPFYGELPGFELVWPHNVYLYYANILGFVGLVVFLWLMWKLLRMTRPVTDDLRDPDYARAYLTIAQVQLVVFLVNETKIDYLRNPIYQFVVWIMFASMASAHMLVHRRNAPAAVLPEGRG